MLVLVSAAAAGIHRGRLSPAPPLLPAEEDGREVERDDRVGAWLRWGLMVMVRKCGSLRNEHILFAKRRGNEKMRKKMRVEKLKRGEDPKKNTHHHCCDADDGRTGWSISK